MTERTNGREDAGGLITGVLDGIPDRYGDRTALKTAGGEVSYSSLCGAADVIARRIACGYDGRYRLSKKEKIRYRRNILLWGVEAQEKLKSTTVFVAGAGGSGSPLIMQLALCGFGRIIICDFDGVELSNLNRQCLHDETRIGMNKALSAKLTVNRLNPEVNVAAYPVKVDRGNISELVGDSSIIFDNVDDLETKFLLSEYAVCRGMPYILSSMMEFNSYAVILNPPETPCLDCLYDRKKVKRDADGLRELVGGHGKNPIPVAAPPLFLSAGFACNEAVKYVLGLEGVAYNRYFLFNQRGTGDIVGTDGYKAIVYPFNNHFRSICREQGFDWDEGWRGKFLEELYIRPDPECPVCGAGGRERLERIYGEKEAARRAASVSAFDGSRESRAGEVALLYEDYAGMLAPALGAFKAGAAAVPLNPSHREDALSSALEDSGARLILTAGRCLGLAEKIRDRTNRNIKIIDTGSIPAEAAGGGAGNRADPEGLSYVLYAQEGDRGGSSATYRELSASVTDMLENESPDGGFIMNRVDACGFGRAIAYLLAGLVKGETFVEREGMLVTERLLSESEDRSGFMTDFGGEFDNDEFI